ncbi:MAG TPA: peptidoglycan DD-metalloendopeptidase family protein [Ramlibacter sp.]|nr:peptidoglycan DD-metalloendopeptidase family protein [Ramlibacter sp.]
MVELRGRGWMWATVLAAGVLAGCASGPRKPAPVEDRSITPQAQPQPAPAGDAAKPVPVPVPEAAGKPGYYTVRPGDTLIRIALDSGQNWRDVARWNNIENPNIIEVGQVLRVVPPGAAGTEVAVARPVTPSVIVPAPVSPASATSAASAASAAHPPAPVVASLPPVTPTPAPPGEEELPWAWPTAGSGTIVAGFDEQRNKGVDIAGKSGDPVLASADGRVVYAGAGLRGYGNLIILKHNNTYLSAYAHNQTLLVKEDQTVRKGQKIAEMGSSDADRVKLHFEIRRQGRPVDPVRYLPARSQ